MPMRYLPFAFTKHSALGQASWAACDDPRRRAVCGSCGGVVPIATGAPAHRVRCPHCWRWQAVATADEQPWRLSEAAVSALRRTRSWIRG